MQQDDIEFAHVDLKDIEGLEDELGLRESVLYQGMDQQSHLPNPNT